jgi:hypothetical protein
MIYYTGEYEDKIITHENVLPDYCALCSHPVRALVNPVLIAATFSLCGYFNDTLQSTQQSKGFAVKSNGVNATHSARKLHSVSIDIINVERVLLTL